MGHVWCVVGIDDVLLLCLGFQARSRSLTWGKRGRGCGFDRNVSVWVCVGGDFCFDWGF